MILIIFHTFVEDDSIICDSHSLVSFIYVKLTNNKVIFRQTFGLQYPQHVAIYTVFGCCLANFTTLSSETSCSYHVDIKVHFVFQPQDQEKAQEVDEAPEGKFKTKNIPELEVSKQKFSVLLNFKPITTEKS